MAWNERVARPCKPFPRGSEVAYNYSQVDGMQAVKQLQRNFPVPY
jgi:hypothetical protein